MKLSKVKKHSWQVIFIGLIFISLPLMADINPSKLFPDFEKKKEEIGKIHILGDFLHLQDIKGKVDVFKLNKSKKLCLTRNPALQSPH